MTDIAAKPELEFVISRVFKAPRQRVWDAWTKPEIFKRWFGPRGSNATVLAHDLRPGGYLHCHMKTGHGLTWGRFTYKEVVEPSHLVWSHAFADENANIVRAPFSNSWPMEVLTVVTFDEVETGTKVTLLWSPINATPEERATFEQAMQSMTGGWSGSFDVLDEVLSAP